MWPAGGGANEFGHVSGGFFDFDVRHWRPADEVEFVVIGVGAVDGGVFADDDHTVAFVVESWGDGGVGSFTTVVPGEFEGWSRAVLGEFVVYNCPFGEAVAVVSARFGLYGGGSVKIKGHVGHVEDVAAHVSERAGTKIPPSAPGKWVVALAVVAIGPRAKPEVEVEFSGGSSDFGAVHSLLPPSTGAVGPKMNLFDVAERAFFDEGGGLSHGGVGGGLVAHLGGKFFLADSFAEDARFRDGSAERLFTVNVEVVLCGKHGGDIVMVIGGADDHSVHLLAVLLEHIAVVLK